MTLSVVMVTKNSGDVVEGAVKSVEGMWDELLVGDGGSRDGTVEIVRKYRAKVYTLDPRLRGDDKKGRGDDKKGNVTRKNLGERKQELVEKAKGDWILVLDADERVSPELAHEISRITAHHKIMLEHKNVMDPRLRGDDKKGGENDKSIVACRIPYQNYVFGKAVYYGGEKYAKVRLFRRGTARISPEPLHEEIKLDPRLRGDDNRVGELRGVIHHHSYRTPWQLFTKFTRYAWIAAGMDPRLRGDDKNGVGMALKRLFLYGPHLFWARFVTEQGYKDGWQGLVLALAFGYMEGLAYWLALLRKVL